MRQAAAGAVAAASSKHVIALAGNPNSGKTTLFNALTGLRQKVGNYPGVTVERKMGILQLGTALHDVLDLPGTYSLTVRSPEERIARTVILGEAKDTPRTTVVVVVVDASNLDRNLYLAGQVLDLGAPTIIALNMIDVAERSGVVIDAPELSRRLGVPVVPMCASRGIGIDGLLSLLASGDPPVPPERRWRLSEGAERAIAEVAALLRSDRGYTTAQADAEAIRCLGAVSVGEVWGRPTSEALRSAIETGRSTLTAEGFDPEAFEAEARYRWIRGITRDCVQRRDATRPSRSDRADAILTHRVAGPLTFLILMGLVFQAIFAWAAVPMDWIDRGMTALAAALSSRMGPGPFRDLLVDGVVAGVGSVVIFLPQILFLFLFIGLLEDTGYMARAAFMMDRLMRRVGLHGKAFIPLLSSFACAVPGIMATRTIENRKDRFVTILVAPLMTCSARLPVYTLIIATFIAGSAMTKALVLGTLYAAGVVIAIGVALLLKKTLFRSETPALILELPPYRLPNIRSVLLNMWDRARMFLQRAGTVILSVSVIMWFLASYPKSPVIAGEYASRRDLIAAEQAFDVDEQLASLEAEEASAMLRVSFAGRLGSLMEPVISPLGFDWRIGIGILSSFAAREVFVSTLGTIYSVGDVTEDTSPLADRLRSATWQLGPHAGNPVFTLPVVVSLLVFYVIALQCMSTVATIWRETGSWRWPVFAWSYMAVLAYAAAFIAKAVTTALV
ncbi:ferrous iron transport protein B [Candidatus Poribacteria bacterium]|nr:ferrous iron transport protein B [Candidatus Poribacteria bacterium]